MNMHWELCATAIGGLALVAVMANQLPSSSWSKYIAVGFAVGLLAGVDGLRRPERRFFVRSSAFAALGAYWIVCFAVWVAAGGALT